MSGPVLVICEPSAISPRTMAALVHMAELLVLQAPPPALDLSPLAAAVEEASKLAAFIPPPELPRPGARAAALPRPLPRAAAVRVPIRLEGRGWT